MTVGWFSRRKRTAKRSGRKLPRRELAPVEDIVEQGMLVADVAVRMTVKNAIIMNALKRHVDYNEQQIIDMVHDSVVEVASERERDAEHIGRMRGEIRRHGRSSWTDADYGNSDSQTLRHREEVYAGVAQELRQRSDDPKYLRVTAERARSAAWEEIGDSLKNRASEPYYGGGGTAEYAQHRDERIDELIANDLASLLKERGAFGAVRKRERSR